MWILSKHKNIQSIAPSIIPSTQVHAFKKPFNCFFLLSSIIGIQVNIQVNFCWPLLGAKCWDRCRAARNEAVSPRGVDRYWAAGSHSWQSQHSPGKHIIVTAWMEQDFGVLTTLSPSAWQCNTWSSHLKSIGLCFQMAGLSKLQGFLRHKSLCHFALTSFYSQ